MFRKLDSNMLVAAAQLRPEHFAAARAMGVAMIVNNRPDGEEPDQPCSAEMEAAARALGLDYRHIPIVGGFPDEAVAAMEAALERGPVLAGCRSGTRSTFLWALARASRGADATDLVRRAAEAGYDLSPLIPHLR